MDQIDDPEDDEDDNDVEDEDDAEDEDKLTDEEADELDKGYPDYDGSGEPEHIDRDNDPPDSENPWKKSP